MRYTLITTCAAALLIAAGTSHPAAAQAASVMPAVSAVAVIAQNVRVQQPPDVNVDIKLGSDRGTVWYANPVWIAVGLLAVVVLGLVIGMVARGGGGSGATIVK